MANNILSKAGITTGATVETWHVTQSIDAFTGAEPYDIALQGTLDINSSVFRVTSTTIGFTDGFLYDTVSSSLIIGAHNETVGNYSLAAGSGLIISGSSQTVVGQYNTHGDYKSPFIVGIGGDDTTRLDAFKVTSRPSIILPQTRSVAPAWSGSDGEIVPVTTGSRYYLYMWMNGAWKRTEFT